MSGNTIKINGNSSDYGWGQTLDGKDMVVWKGDWHQIYPSDTKLQFNDGIGTLAECGVCEFTPNPIEFDGKIWGDPHFVGADGGKYDVHGEHGKVYNILSDAGIQVNSQFANWNSKTATIMNKIGIVADGHTIAFDRSGKLTIDGEAVTANGSYLDGAVTKNGLRVQVETEEYSIALKVAQHKNGNYLNIDFASDNAAADGILPHGLWGQTADGDGIARNGDRSYTAQGGGAIEDENGNITAKGDKQAYKSYEVDGLFDTTFTTHNRFYDAPAIANDTVAVDGEAGDPEAQNGPVFKLVGNSGDFGWGPTEDGTGIVVWKGEWFQILEKGTQLQFDDKLASTDPEGMDLGELQEQVFVAEGSSDEFGWGKTLDGEGYVIWQGEEFDLLYNVDQIVFTDTMVELDAIAA